MMKILPKILIGVNIVVFFGLAALFTFGLAMGGGLQLRNVDDIVVSFIILGFLVWTSFKLYVLSKNSDTFNPELKIWMLIAMVGLVFLAVFIDF